MKLFSKFSIWDNEVKAFIDTLCAETKLPAEKVTDWFYGEGLITFIESQGVCFNKDVDDWVEKHKSRPPVLSLSMLGQKYVGFTAMIPLLAEQFASNDEILKRTLTNSFKVFLVDAVDKYKLVYQMQAEVTSAINQFQNEDPNYPKNKIFEYCVARFSEFKKTNPEYAQQMDDQIQLMTEYAQYKRKQFLNSQPTHLNSPGSPSLFNQSSKPETNLSKEENLSKTPSLSTLKIEEETEAVGFKNIN